MRPIGDHRRGRPVRIPMTSALRDQFAMQLHISLRLLETAPDENTFEALAVIFNVVQLAIKDDARRSHDARLINGGAATLNQHQQRILAGRPLRPHEIAPIRVGVNTIDAILGKVSVDRLYLAMQTLRRI